MGRTAVHYAASDTTSMDQPECIRVLATCGAPAPSSQASFLPEQQAIRWALPAISSSVCNAPCPSNLLDGPPCHCPRTCRLVDVQTSAGGCTPLHYAAWTGSLGALQALLSFDARQDVCSSSGNEIWIGCTPGCSPLHLAAMRGHMDVAKALLLDYVGACCTQNLPCLRVICSRSCTTYPSHACCAGPPAASLHALASHYLPRGTGAQVSVPQQPCRRGSGRGAGHAGPPQASQPGRQRAFPAGAAQGPHCVG